MCFGSPSEIKGIMQLFHNRRNDTGKLGGTIVETKLQHSCQTPAIQMQPENNFTMAFRNRLKNEHVLLYMYFTQNSAILQPSKCIFYIAKIRSSTGDNKYTKSIQFHLALPLFSTFFSFFSQASWLLDSCPGILTQKGSRQLGELVVPNTCLRGYSNETSILFLLCPTAPIHQYRKQVYKAEDRSLSISLNQLLFLLQ